MCGPQDVVELIKAVCRSRGGLGFLCLFPLYWWRARREPVVASHRAANNPWQSGHERKIMTPVGAPRKSVVAYGEVLLRLKSPASSVFCKVHSSKFASAAPK